MVLKNRLVYTVGVNKCLIQLKYSTHAYRFWITIWYKYHDNDQDQQRGTETRPWYLDIKIIQTDLVVYFSLSNKIKKNRSENLKSQRLTNILIPIFVLGSTIYEIVLYAQEEAQ